MTSLVRKLQQRRNNSLYKYSPLPGPTWTRVVKLQPRTRGKIEVVLDSVDLAETNHQEYIAVSYAWQGQKPTEQISCNGFHFEVSKTLLSCLKYLRDDASPVVLWVDAICINQAVEPSATRERSQQVQIIGQVFARASKVVAYLGPEQNGDLHALSGLSFLAAFDEEYWEDKLSKAAEAISSGDSSAIERYAFFEDLETQWPEGLDPFVIQLRHLLDRPFFSRLWIVQELVMAKEFDVMIGHNRVCSSSFRLGLERIKEYVILLSRIIDTSWHEENHSFLRWLRSCLQRKHKTWETGVTFAHLLSLVLGVFEAQGNYHNSTCMSSTVGLESDRTFCEVIRSSRFLKATDPRDHIFAVVGLSSDRMAPELQVDYTISEKELGERIALYMMRKSYGISLLLEFCHAATHHGHGWRLQLGWSPTNSLWFSHENHICLFNAHGNTELTSSVIESVGRPVKISLRGERLGSIDAVCKLTYPGFIADNIDVKSTTSVVLWGLKQGIPFYSWIEETSRWILDQVIVHHNYDLDADFETHCWRTVFADTWMDQRLKSWRISKISDTKQDGLEAVEGVHHEIDFAMIVKCSHVAATNILPPDISLQSYRKLLYDTSALLLTKAISGCRGRKLGRMGSNPCLLPGTTQVGDEICVIHGCPLPFVLRPLHDGTYIYIGTCYVDGMMDGEALLRPVRTVRNFELWPGDGPDDV